MNAAKQKMFEDVRAAVAGRIADAAEIRELAQRVADESVELRRRVERAVAYARDGLRLEACAEAEAEPSVFELAQAFDSEHVRKWGAWCSKQRLPAPEAVSPEAIGEVEEAIALTAPLRSKLAKMRRLVLSDAAAWERLEVLRILVSRDPESPSWQQDRDAIEPVAAKELVQRTDARIAKGELDDAAECVARLEDGKWAWAGIGRAAQQARASLDRALAVRLAEDARSLLPRLDAEWSAQSEDGVRRVLADWDGIAGRMESCGGAMPGDVRSRMMLAREWISSRDADEASYREHEDRAADLRRVLDDPASPVAAVRAAVRAAEETAGGVPDALRADADRALAEHERRARVRRVSVVAGAAVALLAIAAGAVVLSLRSQAERRAAESAAAIEGHLDGGRLQDAEAAAAAASQDAELAAHPRVAGAIARSRDARAAEDVRARAMREEIDALRALSPESVLQRADAVLKRCGTPAETEAVERIVAAARRDAQDQLARRTAEGRKAVQAVEAKVAAAASPDAAQLGAWESELRRIESEHEGIASVLADGARVRVAIDALRRRTEESQQGRQRSESLLALGSSAGSVDSLVAALRRFKDAHPDAPESAEVQRAIEASAAWSALESWRAERDRPTARLATAPQPRREAAREAMDRHLKAHPSSPYAADCMLLAPMLADAPEWRSTYLPQKLEGDDWKLFSILFRDGTRWYVVVDPTRMAWGTGTGTAAKRVPVAVGHAKELPPRKDEPSPDPDAKAFVVRDELVQQSAVAPQGEGPSPERTLAAKLRERLEQLERFEDEEPNDVDSFLDAVGTIAASGIDPIHKALVLKGLITAAAPDLPEPVRTDVMAAVRPIERLGVDGPRGSESFVEWLDPKDPKARDRRGAARTELAAVVKAAAWKESYARALGAVTARLGVLYEPAGVLAVSGGKPTFLPAPGKPPAQGTELWVLDAARAGEPATMSRLGSVAGTGGASFVDTAARFPTGTMLFRAVRDAGGAP